MSLPVQILLWIVELTSPSSDRFKECRLESFQCLWAYIQLTLCTSMTVAKHILPTTKLMFSCAPQSVWPLFCTKCAICSSLCQCSSEECSIISCNSQTVQWILSSGIVQYWEGRKSSSLCQQKEGRNKHLSIIYKQTQKGRERTA